MKEKIYNRILPNMKAAFAAAIFSGIIAHATLLVLQPVTADPVLFLDWWKHGEYQLYSQGRWMANFACALKGYVQPVLLNCLIRILDCGICAALLSDLFRIKNRITAVLLGIAVVVHPYVANTLLFYVTCGTFTLSIVIFTVWNIWNLNGKPYIRVLISAILLMFCTAEAQTCVCLVTLTVVMKCILELLNGHRQDMIKRFVWSVSYCAVGCGAYMVVWKMLSNIKKIDFFYGGAQNYDLKNTIAMLGTSIANAYSVFISYFRDDGWIHNLYWKRDIFHVILLIIIVFFIIRRITVGMNKKTFGHIDILLLILLIASMPLAASSVFLIVTEYKFYLMTATAFIAIIPFELSVIEDFVPANVGERHIKFTAVGLVCVIIWTFIWSDNAGYILVNNTFKQTKSLAERVLIRMEETEGFSYDMDVCFIGQPSHSAYQANSKLIEAAPGGTFDQIGVWPGIWENSDGWGLYIYHYTGVRLHYYSNGMQDRIVELSTYPEFKNADVFPGKDSVQIIDNVMVVKLGEVNYCEE